MKATLVKKQANWYNLYHNDIGIGSTHAELQGHKLSLKNCQAIENGYDLDELAEKESELLPNSATDLEKLHLQIGFVRGAKAILEILGDKKFSEEQLREAFFHVQNEPTFDVFKQSLQQTEWDVEILEGCLDPTCNGVNRTGKCITTGKPKLDANGCLILKRI